MLCLNVICLVDNIYIIDIESMSRWLQVCMYTSEVVLDFPNALLCSSVRCFSNRPVPPTLYYVPQYVVLVTGQFLQHFTMFLSTSF